MPTLKLTFDHTVNVSAQEGDILYFNNTTNNQGGNSTIIKAGRTPFIHAISGKLGASNGSYSFIEFYNFNSGINNGMIIECVVSGSLEAPPILAANVIAGGTTITNVTNTGLIGSTCRTSIPALDLLGGHNYKFKLTTPGVTTLEVQVTSTFLTNYFNVGCSTCLTSSSFLLFSKDNNANMASMLGYYAEAKFTNNTNQKAELFSVGSEVTQSSK